MQDDSIESNITLNTSEMQAEQSGTNTGPATAAEPASSQTSERKKQANRENAKHSTGPKTDAGKTWSRLNAVKHGFARSDVIITKGAGKEDPQEFYLLHEGLLRAWRPTDAMQEQLVMTITECDWRLRRVMRAEAGEISLHTDSYARHYLDISQGEEPRDRSMCEPGDEEEAKRGNSSSGTSVKQHICNDRSGIRMVLLAVLRNAVQDTGLIDEELQNKLHSEFGEEHILATSVCEFSQLVLMQQLDDAKPNSGREQVHLVADLGVIEDKKQELLTIIDDHMKMLHDLATQLLQAEEVEHEATLRTLCLPSKEVLDRLIRYETALERRKLKSIELLLRLQEKKK
jgi:hypothetical protein